MPVVPLMTTAASETLTHSNRKPSRCEMSVPIHSDMCLHSKRNMLTLLHLSRFFYAMGSGHWVDFELDTFYGQGWGAGSRVEN